MKEIGFDSKIGIIKVSCKNNIVTNLIINSDIISSEDLFLNSVKNEIEEYLSSKRDKFSFDFEIKTTEFRSKVLKSLLNTKIGTTISYKELADSIGSNAIRACASTMSTNKIALIIPCHRVINSNKTIGNYLYSTKIKKEILLIERSYRIRQISTRFFFKKTEFDKITNYQCYVFEDLFTTLVVQLVPEKYHEHFFWYFDYKITPFKILELKSSQDIMICKEDYVSLKKIAKVFDESDYSKYSKKEVILNLEKTSVITSGMTKSIELLYEK